MLFWFLLRKLGMMETGKRERSLFPGQGGVKRKNWSDGGVEYWRAGVLRESRQNDEVRMTNVEKGRAENIVHSTLNIEGGTDFPFVVSFVVSFVGSDSTTFATKGATRGGRS